MGELDVERQALNVFRMKLLGRRGRAGVVRQPHAEGRHQRGPARLGRHASRPPTTASGRSSGPHPYPWMVREFQRVIGDEARAQCQASARRRRPGLRRRLRRRRFERGGHLRRLRRHRRRARRGRGRGRRGDRRTAFPASCTAPSRSSCRTSTARCWRRTRSRPGSTIPASAPSTRISRRSGRADVRVRERRRRCSTRCNCLPALEGIIPALEPAHAIAWLARAARAGSIAERRHRARDPVGPRRQGRRAGDGHLLG